MPFDNAPERPPQAKSVYERLCILRELLPRSGDQDHWASCLWYAASRDQRLGTTGQRKPTVYDYTLFGPRAPEIFSTLSKSAKAWYIQSAIAEEGCRQQATERGLLSPEPGAPCIPQHPQSLRWIDGGEG